ncbi:cytochrome P450 [Mycena galopus ATCC 62051]|nr:cytochrome P450 [Mycena galopus ATCC 62051]
MAMGFPEVLRTFDSRSLLLIASLGIVSGYWALRARKTPRLPRGPRGIPFLGNILDIPRETQWLKFSELADIWGDIFSLTVPGKTMIIVSSAQMAEDLLDVRGANFSDRMVFPVGGELAGFRDALPLVQYGDRVRKERKLFHQLFGTHAAIERFVPLVSAELHKLLRNIVLNPNGFMDEISRATGAITLRIAYGYHQRDGADRDPLLKRCETVAHRFFTSSTPGAFLVDIIPVLRYWPEWLPGGGFHTTSKKWFRETHETLDDGLNYVKNQMAAGTAEPSFLSALLEAKSHDDYLLKWAAITIEVGGSDTTAAQLEGFFLAMTLFPEIQAAAQREIDQVVGNDRLPDASDRAQLPYVDALCKEVIRWHVAAPLGVPHRTREDFIYDRGDGLEPLLIPKDSLIIPNLWKMARDPERYVNPTVFDPSRFLSKEGREAEQDPGSICFGYGRRICPGQLLAEMVVFLGCSAILSVFNISKARENGAIVEPVVGQTAGSISHLLPFRCAVEPRNERAQALIESSG